MRVVAIVTLCVGVSLFSGLAGAFLCKNIYLDLLDEKEGLNQLQNIAFSQLLLENMDGGNFEQARVVVLRNFNSLVYSSRPEIYSENYTEACLVLQAVYRHRLENLEKYSNEGDVENKVWDRLKFWGRADCKISGSKKEETTKQGTPIR